MRLPDPPQSYDPGYMRRLVQTIERTLPDPPAGTGQRKFLVQNFTQTMTLDLATASQADVNNFLATVVNEIVKRGLLT